MHSHGLDHAYSELYIKFTIYSEIDLEKIDGEFERINILSNITPDLVFFHVFSSSYGALISFPCITSLNSLCTLISESKKDPILRIGSLLVSSMAAVLQVDPSRSMYRIELLFYILSPKHLGEGLLVYCGFDNSFEKVSVFWVGWAW